MKFFIYLCLNAALCSAAQPVTFTENVAPILFRNCVQCHRPGEAAPMSLMTYKEARPWAAAIREAVQARKMPPWHSDPHFGKFSNDPRLSDAEIATLAQWAVTGAKEGDPAKLPAAPQFAEGWRIGTPDAVVSIPQPVRMHPKERDRYLNFRVPTDFGEDKWITGVELRPGNRRMVHHAHVYLFANRKSNAAEKSANPGIPNTIKQGDVLVINPQLPVRDDGCSLPNGGEWPGKEIGEEGATLGTYLPGREPDIYGHGLARRIPAGSVLQFQIHYNADFLTDDASDLTSVGFVFAKEPPRQPSHRLNIGNKLFLIPAGDANHEVRTCFNFQRDVNLTSITGHMHLRGKDMRFDAVRPDGRQETLLFINHYDFNWQTEYKFAQPISLERGTRMIVTAHFDNSANNAVNPDPTRTIRWGEPSDAEMMDSYFEFVVPGERIESDLKPLSQRKSTNDTP